MLLCCIPSLSVIIEHEKNKPEASARVARKRNLIWQHFMGATSLFLPFPLHRLWRFRQQVWCEWERVCICVCVWDADCLLTASAGAGAAAVCEKFPWSEREREAFVALFSLCFRISLSSSLSLGSFARQTRSRAIKFRGAIFINYGMPAGPHSALSVLLHFSARVLVCVFLQQRVRDAALVI